MNLNRFRLFKTSGKNSVRSSSKPMLSFLLGALAAMTVGLVAGLYFFFPASAVEERIEYEIHGRTPVQADLRMLSLGFPLAMQAEKIILTAEHPQAYSLSLDRTSIKPLWRSLLGRNPGVVVHTGVLGGEGTGSIRRNGAMELNLARILFDAPLPSLTSLRLSGTLQEGNFIGAMPVKATTESRLDMQFEKVVIAGLNSVGISSDTLSLGTISLKGTGRGNSFRIEQLDTTDGGLKVSGSGTVLLGRTVELSRLNLNVAISPVPSLDAGIADMLSLLKQPGRDGSYRFRITGTVAKPTIK